MRGIAFAGSGESVAGLTAGLRTFDTSGCCDAVVRRRNRIGQDSTQLERDVIRQMHDARGRHGDQLAEGAVSG